MLKYWLLAKLQKWAIRNNKFLIWEYQLCTESLHQVFRYLFNYFIYLFASSLLFLQINQDSEHIQHN